MLPLWRFTLRRRFWQPAATTTPWDCGADATSVSLHVFVVFSGKQSCSETLERWSAMPCLHSCTVYLQGVDTSSLPCVLPLERCATATSEQACKQERGTCPALMMAAACGGTRRQLRRPAPRCRHAHAAIIALWLWQQRANACHHVGRREIETPVRQESGSKAC